MATPSPNTIILGNAFDPSVVVGSVGRSAIILKDFNGLKQDGASMTVEAIARLRNHRDSLLVLSNQSEKSLSLTH